ncbi:TauD/TfdA family dioxygenase [Alphaproteobacteria bacterium]|nr:TauD/TfdA family dioxygenase [Alphaproteobacteria bacterium]
MTRFDPRIALLIVALEDELPHDMAAGWTIAYTNVGKVNAAFTEATNGLAADESSAMPRYLYSDIDNPWYQMRVKWRPRTPVIWDNWAPQHFACGDNYLSFHEVQSVTVSKPRYAHLGLN